MLEPLLFVLFMAVIISAGQIIKILLCTASSSSRRLIQRLEMIPADEYEIKEKSPHLRQQTRAGMESCILARPTRINNIIIPQFQQIEKAEIRCPQTTLSMVKACMRRQEGEILSMQKLT
jgi:hypothetical protein